MLGLRPDPNPEELGDWECDDLNEEKLDALHKLFNVEGEKSVDKGINE